MPEILIFVLDATEVLHTSFTCSARVQLLSEARGHVEIELELELALGNIFYFVREGGVGVLVLLQLLLLMFVGEVGEVGDEEAGDRRQHRGRGGGRSVR